MTATNFRETFDGYSVAALPSPWVHVTATGYNRWWADSTVAEFPGGYAYIEPTGTAGLPAVALMDQLEADLYQFGDFYDGLPEGTGIVFRATTTGTDWLGYRFVREDNGTTASDYVLVKRTSGPTETELERVTITHVAGEAPGTLGALCVGTSIELYVNDVLVGSVTDSFQQTATLCGLYGISTDDQKCDTFEGAYRDIAWDWLDSFAHLPAGTPTHKYSFLTEAGARSGSFNSVSIVTNGGAGSQRALQVSGSATGGGSVAFNPRWALIGSRETAEKSVCGAWFYFGAYPSANAGPIMGLVNRNESIFSVCMQTDGRLIVYEGVLSTTRVARSATSSAPVPLNTPVWIGFETKWKQSTTMHYRVMVGQSTWLAGEYDTDPVTFLYDLDDNQAFIGTHPGANASVTVDYDVWEWYYRVGDYPWIVLVPEGRVECLRPDGAGNYQQWTPNGAATNVDCVDDDTVNGGTDYVSSNTAGQIDTYTMGALAGSNEVHSATMNLIGAAAGSGSYTLQGIIRSGGTDLIGGVWSGVTSGTYLAYRANMPGLPNSDAGWTPSLINGLELGPKLSAKTSSRSSRQSQVVLEVLTGARITARRNVSARSY